MRYSLPAILAATLAIPVQAAPPDSKSLTIEDLIDIKHPSEPVWSPDGQRVLFIWDRAGVSNLYVATAVGQPAEPTALTHFSSGAVTGAFWSRDGKTVYFPHDGDLWQVPATGGDPRAVWTTSAPETNIVLSPDGNQVAFVRPSDAGGSAARQRSVCARRWPAERKPSWRTMRPAWEASRGPRTDRISPTRRARERSVTMTLPNTRERKSSIP